MKNNILNTYTDDGMRGRVKVDKRCKYKVGDFIAVPTNTGWYLTEVTANNFSFFRTLLHSAYKIVKADAKFNLNIPILK